jgi:hypothetical protein
MTLRNLQQSTGTVRTDAAMAVVIGAFEAAFPDRVRGYYLHGSVADDTEIGTSDLDLDIVVKGALRGAEERDEFIAIAELVASRIDLELDIEVTDEASLFAGAEPSFKLGSRLVCGEDIRSQVPLIPVNVGFVRMERPSR